MEEEKRDLGQASGNCLMAVLRFVKCQMPAEEAPAFLAHVEDCRDCRGYLEILARLRPKRSLLMKGDQWVKFLRRARRTARLGQEPRCWNCAEDPRQLKLLTVGEAARFCNVSRTSIYRWMEEGLVEWVYNAGGGRRIFQDSLTTWPKEVSAEETEPVATAGVRKEK